MRAIVGDVIGTTDGRYGTVIAAMFSGRLRIAEAVDPDDECPDEFKSFIITQDEVASIV